MQMLELSSRLPNVGLARRDGTVANPELMDFLTIKWLKTFGQGDAARFLAKPEGPQFAPDVEQNMWLQEEYPAVHAKDDDAEHAIEHKAFLEMNPELNREQRQEIVKHLLKHQEQLAAKMQTAQQPPVPFAQGQMPQGQEVQ